MEMGKEARLIPTISSASQKTWLTSFPFLFFLFSLLLLAGCASPGDPIERRPPTPLAITDLAAQQSGNNVILTFTLPRETVQHRPLKQPPSIEILRSLSATPPPRTPPNPSASAAAPLVTIPSALVDRYLEQGHIRYVDALQPTDFAAEPNETATYIVRTRATPQKVSPDSNLVSLPIYPLPDPIDDLKAQMATGGVVTLTWTPPQKTPIGPAPAIEAYRIFRAEMTPASAPTKPPAPEPKAPPAAVPTKSKQQLTKIADASESPYEDRQAEFGKTYAYSVRSVIETSGQQLESSDSNPAIITVRDVYPPSTPQGLVVVFVPQLGQTPAHLELSWAINPETDVAGYNVYRSEQQGTPGARLNPDLLLTPAFRDMSAVAGRSYFYEVTAVDRSGNESSRSAPVAAEMPAESQ